MADDTPYVDDDEQSGGLLGKLISPLRAMGIDPDQARANPAAALEAVRSGQAPQTTEVAQNDDPGQPGSRQPGDTDYAGPQLIRRNAAAPAPASSVPASVTPDGNSSGPPTSSAPKTWQDYARQGLAGQLRATQADEANVNTLASQPTEEQTVAPLEQQRTYAAAPINPQDKQYRPGIGTRFVRGLDAIREGGLLAAVDPEDVGETAYGAPNKQYGIDTQRQAQKVASIDQQIATARQAYKDASNRAKDIATQQRAVATGYGDLSKGATGQETTENIAARNAETARHNLQDEQLRQQQQEQTGAYQQGELGVRNRQLGIDAGRLGVEQDRLAFDKATADIQALSGQWSYEPSDNGISAAAYRNGDKTMSPAEYIDKKNEISAALDKSLTAKHLAPLGLRWQAGPNGQEILQQPQGSQASMATQSSSQKSRPRPAAGSTVMVDGKPHQVVGFNEKTGKPIVSRDATTE
jgi:hypothetical protein